MPGPSAVTAALSVAGVPASPFVFEGFLPIKPGRRRRRLRVLCEARMPVVLYESPHRIAVTLEAIREVFGEVELLVARELTKKFEEVTTGPPAAHLARLAGAGGRGEFTLVIPGGPAAP